MSLQLVKISLIAGRVDFMIGGNHIPFLAYLPVATIAITTTFHSITTLARIEGTVILIHNLKDSYSIRMNSRHLLAKYKGRKRLAL